MVCAGFAAVWFVHLWFWWFAAGAWWFAAWFCGLIVMVWRGTAATHFGCWCGFGLDFWWDFW